MVEEQASRPVEEPISENRGETLVLRRERNCISGIEGRACSRVRGVEVKQVVEVGGGCAGEQEARDIVRELIAVSSARFVSSTFKRVAI